MISAGSKKLLTTALLVGIAFTGASQMRLRGSVRAGDERIIQMVNRSAELYKRIVMSSEPVSLGITQFVNYKPDGTPVPKLVVQMTPDRDGAAVVLTWNTATAHLISVCHCDNQLTGGESQVLAPRAATGIARTWLRTLVLSDGPSAWKLLARPVHSTRYWNLSIYAVRWGSHDREVEMIIEDHTGDLLSMRERPLSRFVSQATRRQML